MSNHASSMSMRDALYEAPGPRTRRRVKFWTVVSAIVIIIGIGMIVRQFYVTGQLDPRYWEFFTRLTTWSFLGAGFLGTLKVSLVAGAIALILGLILMLGRICKVKAVSWVCRIIIDFLRGVPSLLLIYFFFLVIPQYGIKLSSFWMITAPVALAAAGPLAEVFRAGVNAVPNGQVEAAYSLGMRRGKTLQKIILPQAIKFVIPTIISLLVVVVKDTTVAYIVSYPDLLQNGRVLITNYDALVSTYFVIAIIYILLSYAINKASVAVARRMDVQIIKTR